MFLSMSSFSSCADHSQPRFLVFYPVPALPHCYEHLPLRLKWEESFMEDREQGMPWMDRGIVKRLLLFQSQEPFAVLAQPHSLDSPLLLLYALLARRDYFSLNKQVRRLTTGTRPVTRKTDLQSYFCCLLSAVVCFLTSSEDLSRGQRLQKRKQ